MPQGKKISQDALLTGQTTSEPRFYGPRELAFGSLSSPDQTIGVLIPMAPSLRHSQNPPIEVLYQRDKGNADVQEPLPWRIGAPIQTFGNSRVVVNKGPICFQIIQYDYKPVKDQESEGQDIERAG